LFKFSTGILFIVKKNLTALGVKRIKSPAKGQTDHFDAVLPGFALRVTSKGHKSWVLLYRFHGTVRRLTIGSYPAFGLVEARDEARKARQLVEKGIDVAAEKKRQKYQPPPDSFREVSDNFVNRYAKKNNRSWKETERVFSKYVNPAWGKRPINSIGRRDVIELVSSAVDQHGPYMANRILATIRKLFNWCLENDMLVVTPAANVKAPGKETERDRVLSDFEIRAIWDASEVLGW